MNREKEPSAPSPLTTHYSPLTNLIAFAHQLADAAGEIIRPYFGAHGEVEAKADTSPVTIADREAEAAMRRLIQERFPAHGIYGEEFGQEDSGFGIQDSGKAEKVVEDAFDSNIPKSRIQNPESSYLWLLDPIDGTRAFIAGRKEWGTLIALCENGIPVLGILDQPVTGERWVGARGQVTTYHRHSRESWNDGLPIITRPCVSLADAEFSTTSASYFTPVQAAQVVKLAQACRATVRDGDCYAYGLIARGLRDVVVDAGLKPYDILALVPIIEGAGGKITGWDGAPVTLTNYRDVVAVGDRHVQQLALEILHQSF